MNDIFLLLFINIVCCTRSLYSFTNCHIPYANAIQVIPLMTLRFSGYTLSCDVLVAVFSLLSNT